jgi:hypothetical protein
MRHEESGKSDGVIGLAREIADSLERLSVEYLRLARLEVKAEMRTMLQRAAVLGALGALVIVGYGIGMAGLALVLGEGLTRGVALLIIGGIHVVVAGTSIVVALVRLRRPARLATGTNGRGAKSTPAGWAPPAPPIGDAPPVTAPPKEDRPCP